MNIRRLTARACALLGVSAALLLLAPVAADAASPCSSPAYATEAPSGDACSTVANVGTGLAVAGLTAGPALAAAAGLAQGAGGGAAGAAASAAAQSGAPAGRTGTGGGRGKAPAAGAPPNPGTGQSQAGNGDATVAGDPVDVVSGQMVTSETDLELPGLLPLVLRRAYASQYSRGRLFGPGWASTLDQCVEIDDAEIRYIGDDAQILTYPRPANPGQAVLPTGAARWPLTWGTDDVIRVEDPAKGWTRYFPAGADPARRPIAALGDRNGNHVVYRRSPDGLPLEVVHSGGYRVAVDTLATAAWIRISALRVLDGTDGGRGTRVRGFGYDARGRLTDIANSTGSPQRYRYDLLDRITGRQDRLGFPYIYVYDDAGRVVRGLGPGGALSAAFSYDTFRRVTTVTDALGQPTHYHYDRNFRVTRKVDALGATVLTESDPYGRPLLEVDQLGHATRYTLDEYGEPLRVDRPDGTAVFVLYNALRRPTRVTGPAGDAWQYTYDERGNVLAQTDPLGAVTAYTYDRQGHLRTVTDAEGGVLRIETDPAGLPVRVTDATGNVSTARRDAFGRVVELVDALGNRTGFTYTAEGLRTERRHPDGSVERWRYDAEGNEIGYTDAKGAQSTTTYGPFHLQTSYTGLDGARYTYAHDAELRLVSVTGPTGLSWRYLRDQTGRIVGEVDFNGRGLHYRLDAAGRLAERVNGAGQRLLYRRDALGRVLETQQDSGTTTQYAYTPLGDLLRARNGHATVEYTRDALGRVLAETVNGARSSYTYDRCGRRVRRTTPSGVVSTWTYDAAGRPAGVSTPSGALTFEHDAAGRRTAQRLGGGATVTQVFDALGRLSAQGIWRRDAADGGSAAGTTRLRERGYAYRPDGVLLAVDSADGTRSYDLDALGRVTSVQADGWSERYAYDPLGNVADAATSGAADAEGRREYTGTLLRRAGRAAYEYDGQGRLVRTVRRTLSGQAREWAYGWDADDRLLYLRTPEGSVWRYLYDPLGRRIAKQRLGAAAAAGLDGGGSGDGSGIGGGDPVEQTTFAWDGSRLAEQVRTVSGAGPETLTWDYDPDGSHRPLFQLRRAASSRPAASTVILASTSAQAAQAVQAAQAAQAAEALTQAEIDERFHAIVTDLVGAPTELVDAQGRIAATRRAALWGAAPHEGGGWDGEADCPLRFPGQYHDPESGLDYNFERYYDPATGRYLSADPLGLLPAPNQHAYVDNPLLWQDPLGLACKVVHENDAGRFGDLNPGVPGDGLEAHHMPQDALRFLSDRNEGGALVMKAADHALTRTYKGRGGVTAVAESGLPFRTVLARDIADVRRIGQMQYGDPGYYNAGIKRLLAYYRSIGQL